MKAETWTLGVCTIFFVLVSPAYWLITEDPTGTSALVMTALLGCLSTFYLGFHANRMAKGGHLRPEDRKDAEIADGAGELGFFPPYSWWPLWCGLVFAVVAFSIAVAAWWMLIISLILSLVVAVGWVFEYYRGEHAH